MTYPESLHCYSGKFMIEYLNDLVAKHLISESIRITCETRMRYKFNTSPDHETISRPQFIAMCECGVESFHNLPDIENPNKRKNQTLVEGMKKKIKDDKQKYEDDSAYSYGF